MGVNYQAQLKPSVQDGFQSVCYPILIPSESNEPVFASLVFVQHLTALLLLSIDAINTEKSLIIKVNGLMTALLHAQKNNNLNIHTIHLKLILGNIKHNYLSREPEKVDL